ncbi:MAG: DNA-binding protein WhiA [Clostridiales Family XIII bacterium]|jgi:DNA-binding protein WhiA|nr:DNA-binding protein WhiA [Clostridiales Family XIII bacterium]
MSFSADTKNEIAHGHTAKHCCKLAESAGFIKACGSVVRSGNGGVGLVLTTENPAVARHVKTLIADCFSVSSSLMVGETGFSRGRHIYELKISAERGAGRILKETGILSEHDGRWTIRDWLSDSILKKKCCRKACLRGLFLGAGTVSDPEKDYHLEIVFAEATAAQAAKKLLGSFDDIHAKVRKRRDAYVVYIKDAEQIKDILNITGAHAQLLKYENVRVLKDVRNHTNRVSNCDNANADKSLRASDRQIAAILSLKQNETFDVLPANLKDTALARIRYPEATLSELGEVLTPKVARSTVSGRLKQIEHMFE